VVDTASGSSAVTGAALRPTFSGRVITAILVLLALIFGAHALNQTPDRGAVSALALLTGGALGVIFQRGRFCFFCILRDLIEGRGSSGVYAILTALIVGSIGYVLVFGAFLPNPATGRLPPQAHIGPVSWATAAAGLAFGVGMALSGACISGHLYRLGEGYARAPLALLGSLVGFGVGFYTWQSLYLGTIRAAPVAWLPATLGYGGALVVHLLVIGGLALLLLRFLPDAPPSQGGKLTLARIHQTLFRQRWNPLVTGALVGIIGVFAYFRDEPLGVTAQLSSLARTAMNDAGLIGDRLNGLDTFAGCAALVVQTIMDNGLLVGGLVVGSFAAALLSNRFKLSRLTPRNSFTALLGGVLMGWGAMTALGCTVGTLLSGISAFALSGWVFGIAVVAGVWLGIRLKLVE
jgi:uncharacterized protein